MVELAVTLGDVLAAAQRRLEAAGVAESRREAAVLYALLTCRATSAAVLERDQPLAPPMRARLERAVERRAAGWPAEYAAGRVNFRGHWLRADRRALIPRPETEGLVELVIRAAGQSGAVPPYRRTALPPLVADIGTGCGAIAIALALEAPIAGVIATDVSPVALTLATENAAALGVQERIAFRRGPLCEPLLDDRVDILVSNPPYVATAEWEALDASVRDCEPRLALDGGPDGLDPTRELAAQARRCLSPGGLLAVELDARRARETAAVLEAAGFAVVQLHHDLFGRARYATARQPE